MRNSKKNQLKVLFYSHCDFYGRKKINKWKSHQYRGIFGETFKKSGLPINLLHKALKEGIIEQTYIAPGSSFLSGYLWREDGVIVTTPINLIIDKIKSMLHFPKLKAIIGL